jgi:hypothetical protein
MLDSGTNNFVINQLLRNQNSFLEPLNIHGRAGENFLGGGGQFPLAGPPMVVTV